MRTIRIFVREPEAYVDIEDDEKPEDVVKGFFGGPVEVEWELSEPPPGSLVHTQAGSRVEGSDRPQWTPSWDHKETE